MKGLFTYCLVSVLVAAGVYESHAQSYCSSYLSSYEYITNVTFQEIDNTTDYVDGEPADYTDLGPANVEAGGSYPLSVTLEPDEDDHITVFIDWNQNGTLDDAGEEYIVTEGTSSAGPHTIDIDVPADALEGETRMRVILVWDDIPTPCYDEFFGYGEAEDYTVNVAAACSAPSAVSFSAISGTSASINWNQSGTPDSWIITYGAPGFDPETDGASVTTTSKPYVLSGLSLATAYDVYVKAVCSAEDVSSWSSGANFSTLCVTPSVISKHDSSSCGAGTVTLEAAASAGAIIKWYTSLGDYDPVAMGATYTTPVLSEDAVYYVAASGPTTCESTDREAVTASILELPVVNLGSDTFVCPGGTLTLDAGNPGSTYLWNTGALTQTISVDEMGTYSVMVTAADECSAADEVTVGEPPVASVTGFNFIPQYDLAPGTVAFVAVDPINVVSYKWDFGDGSPVSYEEAPVHTYTASGNYIVTLSVLNGCEGSQVSLPISVDLPTGIISLSGRSVTIRVYPNPAKETVIIDAPDQKILAIALYNILGRQVFRETVNSRSYHMPVAELAQGSYLVRITTDHGISSERIEIIK